MLETRRLKELALAGLRLERERIDRETNAITAQLSIAIARGLRERISTLAPEVIVKPATKSRPRTISPEGRKRLSLAAKRRWKMAHKLGKVTL